MITPSAFPCPPEVSAEQPAEVAPSASVGTPFVVVRRYVRRYVNLCGVRLSPTFGSLRQSLQKPRSRRFKCLNVLSCAVVHEATIAKGHFNERPDIWQICQKS